MENRARITGQLLVAWRLVRLSRARRVIQEASRAVQKALAAASHVGSSSEPNDRLARLPDVIKALEETGVGDRWALARELENLRAERVPSHVLAHALIDVGCCNGRRRPLDLQRCLAWERSERRRYRAWQKYEALSRQNGPTALRVSPGSLRSPLGK